MSWGALVSTAAVAESAPKPNFAKELKLVKGSSAINAEFVNDNNEEQLAIKRENASFNKLKIDPEFDTRGQIKLIQLRTVNWTDSPNSWSVDPAKAAVISTDPHTDVTG